MAIDTAEAAPCRHSGAPPPGVVARSIEAIESLAKRPDVLASFGLSPGEFELAYSSAIESIRGRRAASTRDRRDFISNLLQQLVDIGLASSMTEPLYGEGTVYRLEIPNLGSVAIIQKGCPDGAHSSENWTIPNWASETYLWWLCPSLKNHPGENIAKGVRRLRNHYVDDQSRALSGIIFHNDLCGGAQRACPKVAKAVEIAGQLVPPPCIYTMPQEDTPEHNWDGQREVKFPGVLLKMFAIDSPSSYVGHVGFQYRGSGQVRTNITARYGPGLTTTVRTSN